MAAYEREYHEKLDFQMERFAFNADPLKLPAFTHSQFMIDRRASASYSLNRFFCSAPLKTEVHLDLLRQLEAQLAKWSARAPPRAAMPAS
jgi:hypothetical protein